MLVLIACALASLRGQVALPADRIAYSFSADGTECIIHNDNLSRPWLNRLSNDVFITWVTHNGYIESFLVDPVHNGLVNPQDVSGHFYLRDNDTGKSFLVNESDGTDRWQSVIGLGYNRIRKEQLDLKTDITYFIPRDGNLLLILFEIENMGEQPRNMSVFGQVEWSIGDSTKKDSRPSDGLGGSQLNLYKRVTFDDQIMYAETGNWRSTADCVAWPYVGYFAVSEPVSSYETRAENFHGRRRNWRLPQAVADGKCTNTEFHGYDEFPSGVLQTAVTLQGKERKKLAFMLGMERARSDVRQVRQRYADVHHVEQALESTIRYYKDLVENSVTIETPDKSNDRIINIWTKYHWRQLLKKELDSGSLGLGFWAYGIEGDNAGVHPELSLLGLDSTVVRNGLVNLLLKNQYRDPQSNMLFASPPAMLDDDLNTPWPSERAGETRFEVPHHHQIYTFTLGLYAYLIESGDLELLNEIVPYIDGTTATVWDHVRTGLTISIKTINERGLARIPSGVGDWMDEFTKISSKGNAESVMLAAELAYVLRGYAAIAERTGKYDDRDAWLQVYERIKTGVNAHGWDGGWYVRAFSDRMLPHQPIGSDRNSEGKIYLNSQSWPILSGIAPADRADKALDAVARHLQCDYGALIFWPSYSQKVDYIGTQSIYAPGFRNGNIYPRPAAWAVIAAALADRIDLAHSLYNKSSLAVRSRDIDRYLLEPYVYAENYIGPDHRRAGEGQFHWCFGEGAAWMWHAYVGYLLGVRAELDGLLIEPRIPADWDGYKVRRPFRNAIYEIDVRNPNHVASGVESIEVDGTKIKGNVIAPHRDNRTHHVRVIMR